MIDNVFRQRFCEDDKRRPDDERDSYQRDKSRVIHSSAFRRLQAKTQVMGVGEGDFHRTRLTHSIEASQIGEGLLGSLKQKSDISDEVRMWLPPSDLVAASCLAHDLGHPPFGHGGEKALHAGIANCGGFEGNGQTLRIVTRLEKYIPGQGMNPTRRFILALLKYPAPYSAFDAERFLNKPPKCYFDTETDIVNWALGSPFEENEVKQFTSLGVDKGRPESRILDSSIMENADDIAYAVHDLEDIVARKMVMKSDIIDGLKEIFKEFGSSIGVGDKAVSLCEFGSNLFGNSFERKAFIGKLVNLFVTSAMIKQRADYGHPLLKYYVGFEEPISALLGELKNLTYNLVIQRAEVQQLERRGQRIVDGLFEEIVKAPKELVPKGTWESFDSNDTVSRKVCDYIAGMTDSYAEKIYRRLFIPGEGSSQDEL